jgi:hypothetical protein
VTTIDVEVQLPPEPVARSHTSKWSIPLSVVGLLVALGTALSQQHLDPGLWGLPGSISPIWYGGLALIVAGIATARRSDGFEVGIGVVALVLALTATPSIVYDLARYTWTAKHIGVVDYILVHGRVRPSIDIYQSWPGLFSAIAWICKVGGLRNPLMIARFWPPVLDVMVLLAMRCMAGRLLANRYRAWLAAALFFLANAIQQDYFSPQSIALFMAIAIYALVVPKATAEGSIAEQFRLPPWRIGLVVALSLALAFTHQITPFLVGAGLIVLVLFGFLRPRWIPLVPILPAGIWAIVNHSVLGRYFSISSIGDLIGNVAPPSAKVAGAHQDLPLRISTVSLGGGALLVGILALVFLLRNRRRLDVALAVCAASAGVLTVTTPYGNEGILRVTIFALPWLSVLALGSGPKMVLRRSLTVVPVLVVLVATYIFATTGLDGWSVVRPSELHAEQIFEREAPLHAVLVGLGDPPPEKLTARYPVLRWGGIIIEDQYPASLLVRNLSQIPQHIPAVYIYTSVSGKIYGQLQNLWTAEFYDQLVSELRHSPHFETILDTKDAQLFKLKPTAKYSK